MSESCNRGYKCMCFQCGETTCERYETEPPKWIEELAKDDELVKLLKKIRENEG